MYDKDMAEITAQLVMTIIQSGKSFGDETVASYYKTIYEQIASLDDKRSQSQTFSDVELL